MTPFEVEAQGHPVRGSVWGDAPAPAGTVYLVHGWGGRGAQFGAMVTPLVEAGHRVVMFDAPAHGDSDHGPAGPGRTNGVEFAKALDAVFCRFGPAEAVVAHSMGTISTYLAMRYGWLGAERLVFIAPMVESESLFDQFQGRSASVRASGAAFDQAVDEFVGVPVREFDARVQARHVDAAAHAGDHRPRRPADGVRRRGRLRGVDRRAAGHDRGTRASQDPARPRRGRAGGGLRQLQEQAGPDGLAGGRRPTKQQPAGVAPG